MTSEQKLQDFLLNPTLRKEQKQALIEDVMKKQNYSNVTVNLFSALGENNRFNRIDGVVKTFNRIMSAYRGEVLCTVISAKVRNMCCHHKGLMHVPCISIIALMVDIYSTVKLMYSHYIAMEICIQIRYGIWYG